MEDNHLWILVEIEDFVGNPTLIEGYSSTFDDDSYEMHEKPHPQIEFYALEKEHYHHCLMMTEHVAVLQILFQVRKYLLVTM